MLETQKYNFAAFVDEYAKRVPLDMANRDPYSSPRMLWINANGEITRRYGRADNVLVATASVGLVGIMGWTYFNAVAYHTVPTVNTPVVVAIAATAAAYIASFIF